ncbi:MAG: CinA family protein [Candidatus Omnitrophica bacterium]|nr:CinA family protein [Candidatus Omnitrophota bacterium]
MKIEEKVAELLTTKKKTLSIAESCTGGLLTHRLTNIPGSSNFIKFGIVTYCNEAKTKFLKIPEMLLKKKGAVCEEVAELMAKGVRKINKTDFGIGITGIAGPDGGTKAKPVGLVYMAVDTGVETLCLKCQFEGSRTEIKKQATEQALKLLSEFL